MTVLFDIETRSPSDLPKQGPRHYAAHPSTEIISASWYEYDTGRQGLWLPGIEQEILDGKNATAGMLRTHVPTSEVEVYGGRDVPAVLVQLAQSGRPFVAHNAWGFDQIVWEAKTPPEAHPAYWIDTDPLARAVGLPGSLAKIGQELRGEGKHAAGRSTLKKFFDYKKTPKAADLILIGAYCWDDTCGLLKVLWDYLQERPLHEFERKVLPVHREMNAAGVRFDYGLAKAIQDLAGHAAEQAFETCRRITGGKDSPFKEMKDLRKKDVVIDWILRQSAAMSAILPQTDKSTEARPSYSLKKDVVEQLIRDLEVQEGVAGSGGRDDGLVTGDVQDDGEDAEVAAEQIVIPPVVVEFLKVRFAVLRVTGGKIEAAINTKFGGRLHDLLVYFGAHTGRFAGRRMQVHNLPRPKETVPVWDWRVEDKKTGVVYGEGIGLTTLYETTGRLEPTSVQEILDAYYAALVASGKSPAHLEKATLDDAASAMLRATLLPDWDGVPTRPDVFVAGDYNAIELRGGAWVAGEESLLKVLRARGDVYCQMAEKIFGRKCNDKKDPIRQVGKVVVLGCLYQLGEKKLATYAASMGVDLAAAGTTPRACVQAFRDLYPEIAGQRTGDFTEDQQPIRKGGIWGKLQVAALQAAEQDPGSARPVSVGPIAFIRRGADLHMLLPSGRPIIYRNARVEMVVPVWEKDKANPRKREAVVYSSPRGFRNILYGGKLLENAVQALCRDLLAWAMVQARAAGYKVRFHVHDELIASVVGAAQGRDVMRIMSTPPDWASGFPILVEADMMTRYSKQRTPGLDSFVCEDGKELAV